MDILLLTLGFFAASLSAVAFARYFKTSAIVGFLVAGLGIGIVFPQAIPMRNNVELLAEIGVAFLLFEVGSHLPIRKLIASWKDFFIIGPLQVGVVTTLLYLVLNFFGVRASEALLIGFTLSLSSTAVVVKLLQERGESGSPASRKGVSILVFQDIAAVISLSLLGALHSKQVSALDLSLNLLTLIGLLALVLFIGSIAVRPFFRFVVSLKAEDVLTPSALFYVLALAWTAHHLGLSYALGAFLAGVSIAGTPYGAVVQSELQPFRVILLALFFVSVGLALDPHFILSNYALIIVLTAIFMVTKAVGNTLALMVSGVKRELAVYVSVLLSQGSEFAFVLAIVAQASGLLSPQNLQIMYSVVVLSLVVSPLVANLGCLAARSCARVTEDSDSADPGEVIIAEFDEIAWELANALERSGIPYRGHERDLARLALASSRGYNVYFANTDRPRTVSRASVGQARAIVNLIDDYEVSSSLVEALKKVAPSVPIVAATKDLKLLEALLGMGVNSAFAKNKQTARVIYGDLLSRLGYEKTFIDERLNTWADVINAERVAA